MLDHGPKRRGARAGRVPMVLVAALAASAPATAEPPEVISRFVTLETGPLRIRDPFVLTQGFLAPEPRSARVLPRGDGQLDATFTVGNTWAMSGRVERFLEARDERAPLTIGQLAELDAAKPGQGLHFVDAELHRTSIQGRFGLGGRTELVLDVPLVDYGGGFTDSFIEGFHDLISTEQSGRLGTFRDETLVYVSGPDGLRYASGADPSTDVADITVGAKVAVGGVRAPGWDLALEALVELPTGETSRLQGSGGLDAATSVLASFWLDRSAIHVNAGLTWLGGHDALGLDERLAWHASVAWEIAMTRTSSFVLQANASESPLVDLDLEDFDDVVGNVHAGFEFAPSEHLLLHVAISENVVSLGNTVDVAFHFGLTGRW